MGAGLLPGALQEGRQAGRRALGEGRVVAALLIGGSVSPQVWPEAA